MSDRLNGPRPLARRPDPILAALLQLAQGPALAPLSQELQRTAAALRPREPVPRGRQVLPESLADFETIGDLLQLYDLTAPRKWPVGAQGDAPPHLFERYAPGEEELLRLLDRLRQLPPIPVPPEPG